MSATEAREVIDVDALAEAIHRFEHLDSEEACDAPMYAPALAQEYAKARDRRRAALAALPDDGQRETGWDAALQDPAFVAALDEGLADVAAGRTKPWSEVLAALPDDGREGLREAAQAVVQEAEIDDNFEGEYVDYLVPAAVMDRLRSALIPADKP